LVIAPVDPGPITRISAGEVTCRPELKPVTSETDGPFLSVMLIVSDAAAAVGWYKTALGAAELWNLGGVAGLHLGGAPFFVHEAVPGKTSEPSPTDVGLTTTRIELFVDDPGHFVDRAAEAGATDIESPVDHEVPWGRHRQGGFTDPFGHRWSVGDRSPLTPFAR
jgi:PhnB protein